jgi:polysaccharide biosynthesis protein PslH
VNRRLKILFLSRWFPYPADNGSKIRVSHLIAHLSARHEVDLLSFSEGLLTPWQVAEANTYCSQVWSAPYQAFKPGAIKAVAGYFSHLPRSVVATYNPMMAKLIREVARRSEYDVVVASQVDMAPYALLVEGSVKVLEEVELTTLYEQAIRSESRIKKIKYMMMWKKWARYTRSLLPKFSGATVVSDNEKERVMKIMNRHTLLKVIPNGVDIASPHENYGDPQPGSLVYTGAMTYGPNFEAMAYFINEIYPHLRERNSQVSLSITGSLEGVRLENLKLQDGINLTGYLSDVRPLVACSWASVVPLRSGGGTRLKVLESLALGTPVVSTDKGVEGLDLTAGREYLAANDSQSFASETLSLLASKDLRYRLSENGRRVVADRYDWNKIGPCFCNFIEEVYRTVVRQ